MAKDIIIKKSGLCSVTAMGCGTARAGVADDVVDISAYSKCGSATGIAGGKVYADSGNDTISVVAQSASCCTAKAVSCGLLDAGDGDDNITLKASSNGGSAIAAYGSTVSAGQGNDIINVSAVTTKCGSAFGLQKSTLDAGGGFNEITIAAQAASGLAKGVYCSTVRGGSGEDHIQISAKSSSCAYGVKDSLVAMGDGRNSFSVEATSACASAYAAKCSTLTGGFGNDAFRLQANAGKCGEAVGLEYSTINAGRGSNVVEIKAVAVKGTAIGAACSTIITEGEPGPELIGSNTVDIRATTAGTAIGATGTKIHLTNASDDTVYIAATSTGSCAAYGFSGSELRAGDGRNDITITAASAGSSAYGVKCSSKIVGGLNDDLLTVSAVAGGKCGSAYGVEGSTVDLGGGANKADIRAEAVSGTAKALECAKLYSGDGSDVLDILAKTTGTGGAVAMSCSSVSSGAGNDEISIVAQTANSCARSVALNCSTVSAGDGDDDIFISATGMSGAKLSSYVMHNSTIDAGNGNDVIHLQTTGTIASGCNNTVLGGAGNDLVRLDHIGKAGCLDFVQSCSKLLLDGGANNAVIHTTVDGGTSSLGDILSLEHNYADAGALSRLTSQVTVKNFETLLVDLTDGQADSRFNLDSLLNAVDILRCRGNAGMDLMVMGDAGMDSLDAHGRLGSPAHSDVSVEGFIETFTHYEISYDKQTFDLYLQTGVSIA